MFTKIDPQPKYRAIVSGNMGFIEAGWLWRGNLYPELEDMLEDGPDWAIGTRNVIALVEGSASPLADLI